MTREADEGDEDGRKGERCDCAGDEEGVETRVTRGRRGRGRNERRKGKDVLGYERKGKGKQENE